MEMVLGRNIGIGATYAQSKKHLEKSCYQGLGSGSDTKKISRKEKNIYY